MFLEFMVYYYNFNFIWFFSDEFRVLDIKKIGKRATPTFLKRRAKAPVLPPRLIDYF